MKVLAIGSHFDDVELGCGGTIIKYSKKGHDIYILVVTDSEYYTYDGTIIRSKCRAYEEGIAACRRIGIKSLICMNKRAKKVKCDTILIEQLNEHIDVIKPDIIFSHWFADLHEDHYEVARATVVAARHYPSIFFYRSNWYHSTEQFDGRIYVDITDVMEDKLEVLRLHKTEYTRRGEAWLDWAVSRAREAGLRMGIEYAEEFGVLKYKMEII